MNCLNPNNWRYETDGEEWARTHYLYRDNDKAPLGIERIDFRSRAAALKACDLLNSERLSIEQVSTLDRLLKGAK